MAAPVPVMALKKPRLHVATINRDDLPAPGTVQESRVINSHIESHLWGTAQSKIFGEGTAVSGDTSLERFSPEFRGYCSRVQLQLVSRYVIVKIRCKATVIFTQIAIFRKRGSVDRRQRLHQDSQLRSLSDIPGPPN